jgi:hypothetical protein
MAKKKQFNQIENCTNQKEKNKNKIMECIKRRIKSPPEISKNSTVIVLIHHQHHH